MLIERTHYYAKPDRAAEVLRTRREASLVRTRLGLAPGRILVKADPTVEGPDVAWECPFPDAAAQAEDLERRRASPEFEAVRATMRPLLSRFERQVFALESGDPAGRPGEPDPVADAGLVPTEVRFESGGHALVGYLFRPAGPGPSPGLVVNHGSTIHQGTTDVCRPGMAALLASWGYVVFHPHRRGYGNATGPAWRSEVPAEFGTAEYDRALAARLLRESEDVLAALEVLARQPGVEPDRVGLLGSSFGGAVSLLAAGRSRRPRCVVDFAGAAMNWERTPTLRQALLAAVRDTHVPICLVQAANDHSVAPTRELSAELGRLAKPHQARVFPPFGLTADEGHLFAWNGALVWGPFVRAFLDAWLG